MVRHQPTLAILIAALVPLGAAAAHGQTPAERQPVVVTMGESIIRHAPDRAIVELAVESRAATPAQAQEDNAKAMTAVQARLGALGLPASAVQTVAYNLQQEFDYQDGKQTPRDFVASHALEVTVDQIDRVGTMLDAAVQTGATSVRGVRFDLRDRAAAEHEALRRAVTDARARAEAMASGAGGHLGRILRVESVASEPPTPRPLMREAAVAKQGMTPTPIATGEIEIRAEVRLTAELVAPGGSGGH